MRRILHIIKRSIVYLLLAVFLIFVSLWIWNIFVDELSDDEVNFGVTFSNYYAMELGLDWKAAYLATLDDLGVKNLRLAAYWSEIEPENDAFNFDSLDFEINEAEKRNAKVILVVGQKVPRWPECFVPAWARGHDTYREELLQYIETVVLRYKDVPAIVYWQIENEPFLGGFGDCAIFDIDLLDEEITLVKSLDSRQILVTDSGELGDWVRARKRGDIFGTTMYRDVWFKRTIRFRYPLPPTWFQFKDLTSRVIAGADSAEKVIVVEMQAEAWGRDPIPYITLDEQLKYMDFETFKDNIVYSKRAGFPDIYLWGVEWWYYLKEVHNIPEFWNYAKELF
ncbi:MAG: hypothetical protein UX16_C0002G0010 [Parcubacteria group bacterium GW2011_GWB1_45_7]|nr:MAG: hypothetical protein UX16_C0002G0010 [Parcubacteria group bacterium GW2011_GWB1_45_7]